MRLASLIGPDLAAALRVDPEGVLEAVLDMHPEDVAEVIEDLPEADAVALLRLLPSELGADVLERLPSDLQIEIVERLGSIDAAGIVAEMDPDDAVDIVQELDAAQAQTLLAEVQKAEPEAAEDIRELVHHDPETAGGLMTTEYVAMPPDRKVWEAIDGIREIARERDAETIYYIYVCHYGDRLLGVVSLRDLILAEPSEQLGEIMNTKVVRVDVSDDQEVVADFIARYDLNAVPVVDEHERLVGMVTVDDVVDVVIEEATEDAQMMAGVVPLEDSYLATGLLEFVWKRGAWLVLLFLGQLLTATVMETNQAILQSAVSLAIFVPLIISSGGNAGSQSSTLVIRAMAVGEIEPGDWLKVFLREVGIGLLLGVALGAMGFARALIGGQPIDAMRLGLVVGSSIVAIVTLSTVVGSLLPMLIKRIGLDPAVSSTPFIASVVDVLGLLVYFGVAHWVLQGFW
ncbi:MAG: magnesium transporter [Myxococcales bacterium]|nr:magnesium transporter [Myxococcales bacterium]